MWGASPNSLYAVRFLIQYSLAENPTFASSLNGIEAEYLHRLPFVTWLRPYFALYSSFLWLPDCTSPFVLSPLVFVLHIGPRTGNCVSPFVCLITALCILFSFLWLLWDEGFLVFPIPFSTPVSALGQFSFRQVSPLGSPFVSLLVAALRRRNSYVFHVWNDIIRCPLWPQCY